MVNANIAWWQVAPKEAHAISVDSYLLSAHRIVNWSGEWYRNGQYSQAYSNSIHQKKKRSALAWNFIQFEFY